MVFDKQKIFEYLNGKASPFEARQIEEWNADPKNEELFYQWLDEWEREHLLPIPGKEEPLEKFASLLDKRHAGKTDIQPQTGSPQKNIRTTIKMFRWSAAVAMLIILAVYYFPYEQVMNREYITSYDETRLLLLPDGSIATLNANTRLLVPRFGFGDASRRVVLDGEALFSVVSTERKQKFVVDAGDIAKVVVLGTEFRMLARKDTAEVTLNHGKVQLLYEGEDKRPLELYLDPGDHIALNALGNLSMKKEKKEAAIPEWAVQKFRFDKTTLKEITNLLLERFNLEVTLSDAKMGYLSLSGTYEAHRGEELLAIIAEVLDLDVRTAHDKHILVSKSE